MNQNASPAYSEDVLAALPTRATRDPMNGNHTASINPPAHNALCAVHEGAQVLQPVALGQGRGQRLFHHPRDTATGG